MNKANDPGDRGGPIAIRGDVKLGVELTGSEREASLRRGGDGRVARFNGGYLRVGSTGDGRMALHGKEMTLCVRLQDPHGDGNAFLFGKDESTDSYANVLYRQNGYLRYLWQTEPLARRVLVQADKRAGYGFNGESNDQHALALYRPGEFAVSTLTLDPTGTVTLFHNGLKRCGKIDVQRQNVGDALFRVGAKHDGLEMLDGDVAEILVYDRVLSEQERILVEASLQQKWGLGRSAQPRRRAGSRRPKGWFCTWMPMT